MPNKTKVAIGVSVALFVLLGLALPATVNSQVSPTLTPTPMPYPLLFVQNDCVPPCWFGLIPGTSRVEDVEMVLTARPELFRDLGTSGDLDPNTNLPINGTYQFYLGPWPRAERPFYSEINIRDNRVYSIGIAVNTSITLEQVLEIIGPPDWVQLEMIGCWTPFFTLGYQDILLAVSLVPPESLTEFCHGDDVCNASSIQQDLIVIGLGYYSPAAAQEIISGFEMPDQPTFGYHSAYDRDVPLETWNMWLNNEVDITCKEAWEQLPEPILHFTPTPNPTQPAE